MSISKGLNSPWKHGVDAMSRALRQISHSPFSNYIKDSKLPHRFTQPTFVVYNGKTNPIEHVSHLNQRMAIHSKNEAFMCKVFPSNLGPIAMRWFDGLEEGSIRLYEELTKTFSARFVTCSRVPKPIDSLLNMTMRAYSNRY